MKRSELLLAFCFVFIFCLAIVSSQEFGYNNPTLPKIVTPTTTCDTTYENCTCQLTNWSAYPAVSNVNAGGFSFIGDGSLLTGIIGSSYTHLSNFTDNMGVWTNATALNFTAIDFELFYNISSGISTSQITNNLNWVNDSTIDNSTIARTNLENTFTLSQTINKNLTIQDYYVCPSRVVELGNELLSCNSFTCSDGWNLGSGWSITDGNAIHTAKTSSNLTSNATIINGNLHRLTYNISDLTNSNLTAYVGGNVFTTRTSTGLYTEDFTAADINNLTFVVVGTDIAGGLGNELIDDPGFDNAVAWIFGGVPWVINLGHADLNYDNAGNLEETFAFEVTAGSIYTIVLDIITFSECAGDDSVYVQIGNSESEYFTSTGTKTFNLTTVGTGYFLIGGTANTENCAISLDSISVKKYTEEIISNLTLSEVSLTNITFPAGKVCWFDGSTKADAYYLTSDPSVKKDVKLIDNSSSIKFYSFLLKNDLLSGIHYGLMADEIDNRCIKFDEESKIKNMDFGCLIGLNTLDIGKIYDRVIAIETENKKIKNCLINSKDFNEYKLCVQGI